MPTVKAMRYAHSDGHTDVCFDDSGKYMFTCGHDGDVRVWEGIDDDDAVSHKVGDNAYAIVFKNKRFITASDCNTIQAYTFPEGTPDGILTRFTAPANHIVISKSGKTLVAGASDFKIKIVEIDNGDSKTLSGHEAPVLSVALDPQEEFLASSSCDGTVKIWKIDEQRIVKTINVFDKCSDVSLSKSMCRLCWEQRKGNVLYVPFEKEIQIIERNSWNKIGSFNDDKFTGIYSVLSLSPDDKYLAAGCYDGNILIFDVKTKICVDRFKHDNGFTITSMAWNPSGKQEIAFCDKEGQLGMLEDLSLDSSEKGKTEERAKETLGIFEDEDDDFLIDATNDKMGDDNKMEEDNDSDMETTISKARPLPDIDDEDSLQAGSDNDNADDASSVTSEPVPVPQQIVKVEGFKPTPMQGAFQSGSTPVHLSSRYMVWNFIGIIKQYNTEEENSIDIEFTDTAVHHAMHVSNASNYTMADMSTEAVILAAESDVDNPSKLTCLHFGSWDSCKEWSVQMPDGEDIQAITLGEDWIAVATSGRNVRLFTLGGIQKELFSIPGPVVCLAAHTNQLMIAYHKALALPGDQCLGTILLTVDGKKKNILSGDSLPLSCKSTLAWIGFSAEGTPFFMDSTGIVRMLNRKFGHQWIQVANTKSHTKGKSDHYWIVGVNENPQQLRCIPCKGSRYPPTLPRPAVTVLSFQLPMCEIHNEKSQYEETFLRTHLFSNHFDHWTSQGFEYDIGNKQEALKPSQEALMKLFALSARSEREFRALEVCEMMPDEHTLQLAIKYASRLKHIQLAERISELAMRKAEETTQEVEEEEEEDFRTGLYNQHNHVETEWSHTNGSTQEVEDDNEEETSRISGPVLNMKQKEEKPSKPIYLSQGRSNPFKVSSSQQKTPVGASRGTQVFDSLSKKKPEKQASNVVIKNSKPVLKKSNSSQQKLLSKKSEKDDTPKTPSTPSAKTASAFDLWFEDNKSELIEEFPDLSEEDLLQTSTERFRELSKEQRQEWLQKAKQLKAENAENTDTTENKKRKRDDDVDPVSKKKKDTSLSTNNKLAGFAFSKD